MAKQHNLIFIKMLDSVNSVNSAKNVEISFRKQKKKELYILKTKGIRIIAKI